MENFPANSHNAKIDKEEDEPKRVLKVVTNDVVRKPKTRTQRFLNTFLANSDGTSVIGYVVNEILVPAAKDMIADAFIQGVERAIFGETRSPSRRSASRPGNGPSYVNYSRYSTPVGTTRREESTRPPMSRRARGMHDFDEILLATRAEAEEVLKRMHDLIDRYGTVSVSDLYEMLGLDVSYTDEKYGWLDLTRSGVHYTRSGYMLDLPRPEPLD